MKKLKKSIAILSSLFLISSSFVGCSKNEDSSKSTRTLNVFNYGDYINEDLIAKFEEETGIDVIYDT